MATVAPSNPISVHESKSQPPLPPEANGNEKALPAPPENSMSAPAPPEKDCGCDLPPVPAKSNAKRSSVASAAVLNTIPTAAELAKAGDLPLLDAEGKSHTFKSIYGDPSVERHMIIFVRHFFCALCQEYLRTLTSSIPQSTLSSLSPATRLTVIGCGAPELISSYVKETGLPYPIYTDPTSALYKSLHLGRTMEMGNKRPVYLEKRSTWRTVVDGVTQSLKAGRLIMKGGDWQQIGGEFLFVKGEGATWNVSWCHRMATTRDHAEVDELKDVLGLSV